jgi:hypothetical protein
MSWFGLIAGSAVLLFLLFVVLCLFMAGVRDEDDTREDEAESEAIKEDVAQVAEQSRRRQSLH